MNVSIIVMFALASGAVGILFALVSAAVVARENGGSDEMQSIARAIQEGTKTFLKRQYATVAVIAAVLAIALTELGTWTANGFIVGVAGSALAGYIGLVTSVRANVRVAEAAVTSLGAALSVAFRGGAVTGMLVVGLALASIAGYYALAQSMASAEDAFRALLGLALGCSLMSIFARVSGGIFSTAADVGAGLAVGGDSDIPKDDPRNAAVIADYVGGNVGHAAGTAADLYETYTLALVAAMMLAKAVFGSDSLWVEFPLLMGGISLVASVVGTCFVRLGKSRYVTGALYRSVLVSVILAGVGLYYASEWFLGMPGVQPAFSVLNVFSVGCVGLVLTGLIIIVTEYYTSKSFSSAKRIAAASRTGHATNIIAGLAVGLKSTGLPILIVCAAIAGPYYLGGGFTGHAGAGLFAVALAAVAMLSLSGIMVAIDTYGAIADNANGIAEMAGLPDDVRQVTETLDAVGHTTRAVARGYAIGAAGLAALALFAEYSRSFSIPVVFDLSNPTVLIGVFIGGLIPYLFGALLMGAVGSVAGRVVDEVRRQFKNVPGLMDGSGSPQYGRCVDMATRNAIRQTLLPVLIPGVAPVAIGLAIGREALGGMLIGAIVTGLFQAISMASGGGAWDSAKTYIEDGMYGGRGSEAHGAAVTGDTVGGSYKDAAGPAIDPLIKLLSVVSLLIAPLIA